MTDKLLNPWRNADHISQEDFCKLMEEKGYQWKDFKPDPLGTRFRSWYYRTRRDVYISSRWWGGNASLVFFKPRDNPIPDHPRKGSGVFQAIYLHNGDWIGDVTLVEAEVLKVQASIKYLDGEPIYISRTATHKLIPYQPAVYDLLRGLLVQQGSILSAWRHITEYTLFTEHKTHFEKQKQGTES